MTKEALLEALSELTDEQLFSPQAGQAAIAQLAQECGMSEEEFLEGSAYHTILEDPDGHCSPEMLAGLISGTLPKKGAPTIESHVRSCKFCASLLDRLREADPALTSDPTGFDEVFERALATLRWPEDTHEEPFAKTGTVSGRRELVPV